MAKVFAAMMIAYLALVTLQVVADDTASDRETNSSHSQPDKQNIVGLRLLNDTIIRRKDFTGDNWHTTWGTDGHQYVLQCDGRGYNTRLWRLRGSPPDFQFEPVASHPGPKE